jgi:hypothetical protein
MEQEQVAGKLVAELWLSGIIEEDDQMLYYNYFMMAYAAGFDAGRLRVRGNRRRPVAQYTADGKLVEIHKSIRDASKKIKMNESTIKRNLSGKYKTAGGYVWKYVNDSKPTSQEQTVGSFRSQSDPPK